MSFAVKIGDKYLSNRQYETVTLENGPRLYPDRVSAERAAKATWLGRFSKEPVEVVEVKVSLV